MSNKLYESISNIISVTEAATKNSENPVKHIASTYFRGWEQTNSANGVTIFKLYGKIHDGKAKITSSCRLKEGDNEIDAYMQIRYDNGLNVSSGISVENVADFNMTNYKQGFKKFFNDLKNQFSGQISSLIIEKDKEIKYMKLAKVKISKLG